MTSSSSSQGIATRTGPKISSFARRHSFDLFLKIVGIVKYPSLRGPSSGGRPPQITSVFLLFKPSEI